MDTETHFSIKGEISGRSSMNESPKTEHVQEEEEVLKLKNPVTNKLERIQPDGNQIVCHFAVRPWEHPTDPRLFVEQVVFDIARRVITDYFGHDLLYAMTFLDLDDEILKKNRQENIYQNYLKDVKNKPVESIVKDVVKALENRDSNTGECQISIEMLKFLGSSFSNGSLNVLRPYLRKVLKIAQLKESLKEILDSEVLTKTDMSSVLKATRDWESDYFITTEGLNVIRPNVVIRMSDHVPEIVSFMERKIQDGEAFELNGSVYWSQKIKENGVELDQIIWDGSKGGVPDFVSPWGRGRPVKFAPYVFAESLFQAKCQLRAVSDGKVPVLFGLDPNREKLISEETNKKQEDLDFPENLLRQYIAAEIRLACLNHKPGEPLDLTKNTMSQAAFYFDKFKKFFQSVSKHFKSFPYDFDVSSIVWASGDFEVLNSLMKIKKIVHRALCDNINTKEVLLQLLECVLLYETYKTRATTNALIVKEISDYVSKMLLIFGLLKESGGLEQKEWKFQEPVFFES